MIRHCVIWELFDIVPLNSPMFASMTKLKAIFTLHRIRDVISYFIPEKFVFECDRIEDHTLRRHALVASYARLGRWLSAVCTANYPLNVVTSSEFLYFFNCDVSWNAWDYVFIRTEDLVFILIITAENGLVTVTFTLSIQPHREGGLVRPCSGMWLWQEDGCMSFESMDVSPFTYMSCLMKADRWIRTSYVADWLRVTIYIHE